MANLSLGSQTRSHVARKMAGLYVIIDPELTGGRDPLWVAEQALQGGASVLQMRDKLRDKGDSLPLAKRLVLMCRDYDAICIINDHSDLAVAVGGHGVHVGQHDLPVNLARAVLKPWQVAGTSCALVEEALMAEQDGADYIAVGAMFATTSKSKTRRAGTKTLQAIRDALPQDGPPLIAIGGITQRNVGRVARAGADGICVISAVAQAEDPAKAASELLKAFRRAKG